MAQIVTLGFRACSQSIGAAILLSLTVAQLSSCYLIQQGYHQGLTLLSARPTSELASDPAVNAELRDKFAEVSRVLEFAAQQGLNVGGAYQTYIHHDRRFVSYLVQAAYPDRLESVSWWFPFVGQVPYIGFFYEEDRERLATSLQSSGYDVYRGHAAAFSGLGYFEDPIFTSMLRYERSDLAHLFFHELTHRTLWLPGSVRFNENLAEFVGEEITERYLADYPEELSLYRAKRADDILYRAWLKNLRQDLQALYDNQSLNRADKLRQKELLFQRYTTERIPDFHGKRFDWIAQRQWNNAAVLAASLYSPDTESFREAYRCLRVKNFTEYFARLKQEADRGSEGLDILRKVCERNI